MRHSENVLMLFILAIKISVRRYVFSKQKKLPLVTQYMRLGISGWGLRHEALH
tara:strand:+ start:47555 stop:47713 length:159 start_codon:yes stop_codon:yes gene_type:complete